MQKHKNYLIFTIWISTISFIAAGMVGWGAYTFSSSSNAVAKVGNISISMSDLQTQYQNIIKLYEQKLKTTIDNDQAKKLGLENLALQILINNALLENFALDSGIRISDKEVAQEIASMNIFYENNAFSDKVYKNILRENRIKPSDFEESVRKDLLTRKIMSFFPTLITPLEKKILSIPFELQDRLSVQIINKNDVKVNITDDELKKYYEENKESYKSDKSYDIEAITYPLSDIKPSDSDLKEYYEQNQQNYTDNGVRKSFDEVKDKVKNDYIDWKAKRNAMEAIIGLRDSKVSGKKMTINQKDNKDLVAALQNLNNKTEPILIDSTYWAVKIIKENPQKIRDFNDVKDEVRNDYYPQALKNALIQDAKSKVNVFKGEDIGFIGIETNKNILSLNSLETQQVLSGIFNKTDKNGYVLLGDKAVLYKITEQKIATNSSIDVKDFNNFKTNLLEQSLLDFLSSKYRIVNNLTKE